MRIASGSAVVARSLATLLGLALAGFASPAFALTVVISGTFATAALVGAAALGLVGGGAARVMKLPLWVGLATSAAIAALIAFGQHFAFRMLAHDVRFFDEVTDALAPAYTRLAILCGVVLVIACFASYRLSRRWQC